MEKLAAAVIEIKEKGFLLRFEAVGHAQGISASMTVECSREHLPILRQMVVNLGGTNFENIKNEFERACDACERFVS